MDRTQRRTYFDEEKRRLDKEIKDARDRIREMEEDIKVIKKNISHEKIYLERLRQKRSNNMSEELLRDNEILRKYTEDGPRQ